MELTTIPQLNELEVSGKKVLVRVDFNVPLNQGKITDDTRIRAALPTINYLVEREARVILMSHLGRPKGKPDPAFSLEPVAIRLAELLEVGEVALTDSCIGDGARKVVFDLRDSQVAMLENLRFHAGETANEEKFARELATFGDVYVNDAFGVVHRAHASVAGVPTFIREKAAGLLVDKELKALGKLLGEVEHPYVAVLGGAKVSDKIDIIENLSKRVDTLIIGGAIANTFAAARSASLGRSLVEHDKLPLAREILARAEARGTELALPTDATIAESPDARESSVVAINDVPENQMVLDIGPATQKRYREIVGKAGTIFWNGPMGMFEKDLFSEGTFAMARAISGSAAFSVVGGGDSVAAVRKAGLERGFDHVSTGGGASLKLLEGKMLPGLAAIAKQGSSK